MKRISVSATMLLAIGIAVAAVASSAAQTSSEKAVQAEKTSAEIVDNMSKKQPTANEAAAEAANNSSVRNLVINEDRDQKNMVTKVYRLQHISQDDIEPWIKGAVKRYNPNSTVARNDYKAGGEHLLIVTTGVDMMPFVDELIAVMDRPSSRRDAANSIVDGTGIAMRSYRPRFRANDAMIRSVIRDARIDGQGWYDRGNNLYYWKDARSAADKVGRWLSLIDRPVPQMAIKLKFYSIADNDFKELGIDWLAWKNGPGADLFATGYDLAQYQALTDMGMNTLLSSGGFMVAPNIDTTFLKMLEDKGIGRTAVSGSLTLVNDPDFSSDSFSAARYKLSCIPDYQAIQKNSDRNLSVGVVGGSFQLMVNNPAICLDREGRQAQFLRAGFDLTVKEPVDQTNSDSEDYVAYNYQHFNTFMNVGAGTEKLLGSFVKEHKVTQNTGMPFLGDLPVLKYIFGSTSEAITRTTVFITVSAVPVGAVSNNNAMAAMAVDARYLPEAKSKN